MKSFQVILSEDQQIVFESLYYLEELYHFSIVDAKFENRSTGSLDPHLVCAHTKKAESCQLSIPRNMLLFFWSSLDRLYEAQSKLCILYNEFFHKVVYHSWFTSDELLHEMRKLLHLNLSFLHWMLQSPRWLIWEVVHKRRNFACDRGLVLVDLQYWQWTM